MRRRPNTSTGHHVHFPTTLPNPGTWYQANQLHRKESPFIISQHPRKFHNVETFNLHPNVRVSRSAGKVFVTFKTKDEQTDLKKQPTRKLKPHEMEALIIDLREQVATLSTFLEEEKLHHGGSKKRALLDLDKQTAEMKEQHALDIKRLLESNERQINSLIESHSQKIKDEEIASKKREDQLRTEYRVLQASFKNYRCTLQNEMSEQLKTKVEEMEWEKRRAVQNAVDDCRREMEEKFGRERETNRKEFRANMAEVLRDHRIELENLSKKYLDGGFDLEELKRRSDELDSTKFELQELRAILEEERSSVRKTKLMLKDSQTKFSNLEAEFEDRVSSVEDMHRAKIESLTLERADARRLLARSCEEIQNEKIAREAAENERKEAAKRSMEEKIQKCQQAPSADTIFALNAQMWNSPSAELKTASVIDIKYICDDTDSENGVSSDHALPASTQSVIFKKNEYSHKKKSNRPKSAQSNTKHPLRFNVPPVGNNDKQSPSSITPVVNSFTNIKNKPTTVVHHEENEQRPDSPDVIH
uniref:Myosin-14-like n=1 Tax=Ciona intestinalis TaxID=7719 RepID=F6U075_CIOIN|nr:myosin-14-like [Ciona intestinalis]XP_026691847.1 myosin-14-like [Ciona intestinalis]|eukprot:XP_026691846.1 myosin-14-like [Ciona intestinalis]